MIKNMTNEKRGLLTIIKDSGKRSYNGHVLWETKCECGNIKYLTKDNFLRNKSCGCKKTESQSKSLRQKLNRGGFGEIYATHWNGLIKNAKSRNLEFTISAEYAWNLFLSQNRKCFLTGIELMFAKKCWSKETTASLDRIDSTKGYIEGNVQWVHKNINMMKQEYSVEKFLDWCKLVVKHNNLICEKPFEQITEQ